MLINYEINTNLEIKGLKDRRTINKYINGHQKSNSRNRTSLFDEYYDIID